MKKIGLLFALTSVVAVSACSLSKPPDCLIGSEKCEQNKILGGGILFVCSESNTWLPVQSCASCESGVCSNPDEDNVCENEGATTCKDLDSISVQFECLHKRMIPRICGNNCKCDADHCSEIRSGCETEGETQCHWIDELQTAIQIVCVDHEWMTMYCGHGLGCDGDVCATPDNQVSCTKPGEILDNANNQCICDTENHWIGTAGNCECDSGYLKIDSICEEENTCTNAGEILNKVTNQCICDTENHWTGKPGNCECEDGFMQNGNTCEEVNPCTNKGEIWDEATSQCICDTDNYWVGTPGNCECDGLYEEIDGICVDTSVDRCMVLLPGEIRIGNECVCDTANHWVGLSMVCKCEEGYVKIRDENNESICEEEFLCTKLGEILDNSKNQCICDTDNHWKDTAGNCECEGGYLKIDNICEKKKTCTEENEILNEATNQCVPRTGGEGNHIEYECLDEDVFLNSDEDDCITCSELVNGVKVGDSIYFGHYQQLCDDEKKYPIEWQVLAVDDDGVTVISKYILDGVKYNETMTDVTWETSTLRSWLNGLDKNANSDGKDYTSDNFIKTAFNDEELKCIQTVTNKNLDNQNYGTAGGRDTADKIFLLSLCEAGYQPLGGESPCPEGDPVYFTSDSDREAYATSYAKTVKQVHTYSNYQDNVSQYYKSVHYSAGWWLRSPGSSSCAATVLYTADVNVTGNGVNVIIPGVRPVMRLKK